MLRWPPNTEATSSYLNREPRTELQATIERLQREQLEAAHEIMRLECDDFAYSKGYGPVIARLRGVRSAACIQLIGHGVEPYEVYSAEGRRILWGEET